MALSEAEELELLELERERSLSGGGGEVPPPEPKGFLGNAAENILGYPKKLVGTWAENFRGIPEEFERIGKQAAAKRLSPFEEALQATGAVAGPIVKSAIDVPVQAYGALFRTIKQPIPQPTRQKIAEVSGFEKMKELPRLWGMGAQEIAEKHPRATGNIMAGLNIAAVAQPVGTLAAKGITRAAQGVTEAQLAKAIRTGIEKGTKPSVAGKKSLKSREAFIKNYETGTKTIAENRNLIKLTDEAGEAINGPPKTSAQQAQAIDQMKRNLYQQYHQKAVAAGDAGANFNARPVLDEIDRVVGSPEYSELRKIGIIDEQLRGQGINPPDLSVPPEAREYIRSLRPAIEELEGAVPEIVEKRIADLNNTLKNFYKNPDRVGRVKAQAEASIANQMRNQLDKQIMDAVGPGYQDLKNKYGALKAIEGEVNKRAMVNARQAPKGFFDMADIFSGSHLITGALMMEPYHVVRGATGLAIKNAFKAINNPDRYINKMFKTAYKYAEQQKKPISPLFKERKISDIYQSIKPNIIKFGKGGLGEAGAAEVMAPIPRSPTPPPNWNALPKVATPEEDVLLNKSLIERLNAEKAKLATFEAIKQPSEKMRTVSGVIIPRGEVPTEFDLQIIQAREPVDNLLKMGYIYDRNTKQFIKGGAYGTSESGRRAVGGGGAGVKEGLWGGGGFEPASQGTGAASVGGTTEDIIDAIRIKRQTELGPLERKSPTGLQKPVQGSQAAGTRNLQETLPDESEVGLIESYNKKFLESEPTPEDLQALVDNNTLTPEDWAIRENQRINPEGWTAAEVDQKRDWKQLVNKELLGVPTRNLAAEEATSASKVKAYTNLQGNLPPEQLSAFNAMARSMGIDPEAATIDEINQVLKEIQRIRQENSGQGFYGKK